MIFKKLREKMATSYLEKKGAAYSPSTINLLTNNFILAQKSLVYLEYYSQVAPVGDSVGKIASEAATIDLIPFVADDNEASKPLLTSSFVKKMRRPNFRQTGVAFRKEAFTHYVTTGNNYIYLSGVLSLDKTKITQEPLEIFNFRPDLVTPYANTGGYPETYTYSHNGNQKVFKVALIKDLNGNLLETYVEQDGFGVLIHLKEPSTNDSFSMMVGDSPLQSVEFEIHQYLQASIHNTNLLRNGMSARMLFSPKDGTSPPNKDQLEKIRKYLEEEYSGSNNAGKNLLLGMPFDAKALDMNLKDMDFEKLMRRMRVAIYNKLNIPLPLVEGEFTSNTNMKEANLNFYDKAVLPLVDNYSESLYGFVYTPFFKEEGAFKIGYEISSVPALQTRLFENSLLIQKSSSTTMNELREYQGLGRVKGGGDIVYIDANKIAVAGDENFTDTIGTPARTLNGESEELPDEKSTIRLLASQLDSKGERVYSDDDIKRICDESKGA